MQKTPLRILPVIVLSQFAGTSLWFAGNAILPDLERQWNLGAESLGTITSAVQFGFITGTLCFALFALADRYSPRVIFLVCSVVGAGCNASILFMAREFHGVLLSRFMTGVCLAGIYPVGMKIASGWYRRDLGNAIGFLVGALVLGTAFPHLLKGLGHGLAWERVTLAVSAIAVVGGILMYLLVPDGPHLSKGTPFDSRALGVIFESKMFRAAAFGYFGHMWELYTLYAFIPFILSSYAAKNLIGFNVPSWSFFIIAAGFVGCVGGGLISKSRGSAPVAFAQLFLSGLCCCISPIMFSARVEVFLAFLILWGIVVVGDSPQYSALSALTAPKELVGSALTIMNCIGFSITIVSIQAATYLTRWLRPNYVFLFLAIGPALGLMSLWPLVRMQGASDEMNKRH